MPSDMPLSYAAQAVRRMDRERFVTALFAPADRREPLMCLYAFNAEVARVRDTVNEAVAGMMRLQWWREALAGERPAETARNPVAAPLIEACRAVKASGECFERLLEARERDLTGEPFADLAELEAYAADTSGTLTVLALELLGARDPGTLAAGRQVGTAFALTGLVRALPHALAAGRLALPEAVLREAGSSAEDVLAGQAPKAAIARAVRAVGERAEALLADARHGKVDRRGVAALLPATLASGHLRTLEKTGWDVFDARVSRTRPMPVRLALNAVLGRF